MNLELLKNASTFILKKECADLYFDEFNFFDVDCFKATVSKCLGFVIILGSMFVKVPQIVKILRTKSVEGISVLSVMMDLFAATALSSYSYANGFPFSAWGDGVFVALQTFAIAALILYDNKHTLKATSFSIAYASIVASVILGLTPKKILWSCQAVNTPVVFTGKLIQAYTNYQNGSTGQLSAVTVFLLFGGSVARILTSIQETGDMSMIVMYCWTTIANAVLVFQILYYWNQATRTPEKRTKKHS